MSNTNKGKTKYSLAWLCVLLFTILTYWSTGLNRVDGYFHISLTAPVLDSPPVRRMNDASPVKPAVRDTSRRISDSPDTGFVAIADTTIRNKVDSFPFKISKDTLSGPLAYHADDSMVLDVPTKKLYLYGKLSTIKYTDNELAAPEIEYDQRTSLVRAYLKKDSAGKVISYVSYNQGSGFKSVMDSLVLNMKTLRGITKGTYTQQGEMFVYGEKIKKEGTDVFYALNSRFTTCNLDTPHFAFVSNKIKFISQKVAFSGPVHPEFEGVPIPIILPFGIYPLSQGRHSGLLAPTFTANDQYGISLEGLGYYKVFSPNWDMIARGTLYSYGGYAISLNPRYYRRYHYQGNFGIDYQKTKPLDQPSSKTINIRWSHTMDSKARPGVTFTANVTAGSSRYNSLVPNNSQQNFTNQLQSSITYAKVWKDKPFSITIGANHNQNTQTKLINLNLPNVAFSVNTLYPFRRKEAVTDFKWYENIGIGFTSAVSSLTSFYDTAADIKGQIVDNLRAGATHSVPIALSLPPLGVFQVTPNIGYSEKWYTEQYVRSWNSTQQKLDTSIKRGFYTARQVSFGIGASTRIFGMYTFRKSGKVQAIRHEITPTISLSYSPNLAKASYYNTQINAAGDRNTFTKYERSLYGAYSNEQFGGATFSIDNNISMKVRSKKDTSAGGLKKISLLDGLSITGGYNFLRDSFKFDQLSLNARTNLFEKVSITASATIDPYQRNALGQRIDKLIFNNQPYKLGTFNSGTLSLQSGFKGGDKSKKSSILDQSMVPHNTNFDGLPVDDYQREAAYIQNNPGEFVDFSIPWSIDFSYSLGFDRQYYTNTKNSTVNFRQDVNFNTSVNLTPKWKLGVNGSFNITQKELGLITMYLSREMHCWQMSINISRSDYSRYFTINISPKSPMLRDLKVNRTRYFIGN